MNRLGESKSAAKRRAKRYGVCYNCAKSVCVCVRNNCSPFDRTDWKCYNAIRLPATRYLIESRGSYLHKASQLALDDLEAIGIKGYEKYIRYNKEQKGCRSPEETPEFYSFNNERGHA
ncbi:nucleic acid binding protein [Grapevine virus G]|uniref:Nucleic acid binding protein n=1 Tax=Grapevine virus G TaxID=2022475 RepID=A0A291EU57_9VIRU|nr:nucleic acid binding protein [Grapevine virus G]ATG22750.1 nucleic acid binding protein [Grapevine virus G]ATG22760.1 nucleic acid binding protein [Grapevine virus G]